METRESPADGIVALVHVAGPSEREGDAVVQRCLRCDELLATWPGRTEAPSNAFRVGRRVAASAFNGIATLRYAVDGRPLKSGEADCVAWQ